MPVEGVHVVQGQQIDVFLDEFYREEVASYVEVHASVAEAWLVFYLTGGQQDGCVLCLGGDGLAERLDAVEYAVGRLSADADTVCLGRQAVAFSIGDA